MRTSLFALVFTSSAFAAPPDLGPVRPLKVPAGFEVVKVAGPPLVDRPVVCCLDDKGRLYVADSSGSNEAPKVQLEKPTHRIVRLEDTDGDGVYDKSIVFADKMMFLQGVMWKDGSLYVGAPPHIWKLTDTDDDGKADKREIWFDGKTLTGCANDLHGPYAGPDGYIYWTKGAFAKQEYTLPNGKKWASRCATILRAKPDGTGIEPVMTGGMDNPVDVVFLPNGERIFSTTFLQNPANGQRDGLIHAVYGAVYGKDHDPVYELPWSSPSLMPPMTHMGPAAPSGLHRYESEQLGREFHGNLFCAQFNLRTVSRHILKPTGSTYVTEDSPFVTSDDVDFHPTDVIEDADGSLLVVDTGGWYKLCCPSSQLVKADVLGGIYRVKKIGSHKSKFKPPAEALTKLYWASLNRDPNGFDLAVAGLQFSDYQTRRLAAEALGRIGDKRAVPVILKALEDEKNDRVLQHSLTYALIEIGDVAGTRTGLNSKNAHVKRAVYSALNAMPNGLTQDDVADLVRFDGTVDWADLFTKWVLRVNSDKLDKLLPKIKEFLSQKHLYAVFSGPLSESQRLERCVRTLDELGMLLSWPLFQSYVAGLIASEATTSIQYENILRMISSSKLKSFPISWYGAIESRIRIQTPIPAEHNQLLEFLAAHSHRKQDVPASLVQRLLARAQDVRSPDRIESIKALNALGRPTQLDPTMFQQLKPNLLAVKSEYYVSTFPTRLASFSLTETQNLEVIPFLVKSKTTDLPKFLALFDRTRSEPVGLALVKALNTPEMRAKIRVEQVKPILDKYPAAVKAEAEKLYAELEKSRAGEIAKFEALVKELPAGDVRRGQVVFHSQKANCKACHTIGYVGGKVGPDLTRIGGIRTERDLLESIVFPSASFVRSYEPVRVNTKDGRTLNGNIKHDRPDEIVLTVAADQEVRIARENVEEVVAGPVSVMPSGLDQQMTKQELADLVAFLKANK